MSNLMTIGAAAFRLWPARRPARLTKLTGDDLEAVDESGLMVDPDSTQVP